MYKPLTAKQNAAWDVNLSGCVLPFLTLLRFQYI